MSQKELKEAFVSNLTGTSLQEVVLGSFISPVCLLNRGLMWILLQQATGILPSFCHLLLDFAALILPLVISCTIFSDILLQVIVTLTLVSVCMLCFIHYTCHTKTTFSTLLQSHVQFNQVPFVTVFRVFVNVKTAISILAVDFAVFPRRYAKTETYGTGVMDFGVGAFVFANGLVCPEARRKNISGSKINYIIKQLVSVCPLVVLGMGRLLSVKMSDYHEHVTEYGVHWNFFFTLAIIRVGASMLLIVLPIHNSWLISLLISGLYQVTLETTGLKTFIIHNTDRDKNFLHANKEGIFSMVGYVAIYLAGVQVGLYVMRQRSQVKEWLKTILLLLLASFVLYAVLYVSQILVEPVSRRSANLPFCLWTVAQSLFFLSCLGLVDVVLLLSKTASGCHSVLSPWHLHKKQSKSQTEFGNVERFCLIQAVSRNQLLFFLLANVTTGLVNSTVDTLNCNRLFSVYVLVVYMFINCTVVYVLHIWGITVKFW